MMKSLLTCLVLFLSVLVVSAQEELLVIEPGPVGTLNNAIARDTLSDGTRNPNRVYVLRRGIPYLLRATIEYSGWHLRIRAEEGTGPRPLIIYAPESGAQSVDQLFRIRGDLTLDGLHLSNRDLLTNYGDRIVRVSGDNVALHINNCLIDDVGQAALRVEGQKNKIYITNSIFSRLGRPFNPDNGRLIDNRGVPIDTLWIENTVVYNCTSRIYRNSGAGAINHVKLNQNTFYNSGQHVFGLGPVKEMEVTDNLFFNGIFLGRDLEDELETPRYWIEADTLNGEALWTVSHNNFHLEQSIIDAMPLTDAAGDTVAFSQPLPPNIVAAMEAAGLAATNFSEALVFENPPLTPIQFIVAAKSDTTAGSEIPAADPWDMTGISGDPVYSLLGSPANAVPRYSITHSFAYPASAKSFTAGTREQALGANPPNLTSSIRDLFVENNILYFPNPVRDELFIQNLDDSDIESVNIFNLYGQLMDRYFPENKMLTIGMSNYPAGLYFINLRDKSGASTSKAILKQ